MAIQRTPKRTPPVGGLGGLGVIPPPGHMDLLVALEPVPPPGEDEYE